MIHISVTIENGESTRSNLAAAEALLRVNAGRIIRRLVADVPYAKYVIEGTRPHMIYPRTAKALFWDGAAHPVRSVRHPGTQPNNFVKRTVDELRGDVMATVGMGLVRAVAQGNPNYLGQAERTAAMIVRDRMAANAPMRTGNLRQHIRES